MLLGVVIARNFPLSTPKLLESSRKRTHHSALPRWGLAMVAAVVVVQVLVVSVVVKIIMVFLMAIRMSQGRK